MQNTLTTGEQTEQQTEHSERSTEHAPGRELILNTVEGKTRPTLKARALSWPALAQQFTKGHAERQDKDGKGYILAEFTQPHRKAEYLARYHGLCLDLDTHTDEAGEIHTPPPPEEAAQRMRAAGLAGVIYTTHSHEAPPEVNNGKPQGPRYRLVLPLAQAIEPAELEAYTRKAAALLGLDGQYLDAKSWSLAQFFYAPSCRPGSPRYAVATEGRFISAADLAGVTLTEQPTEPERTAENDNRPSPANYPANDNPSRPAKGFADTKAAARGHWPHILASMGIQLPDGHRKHAPCPGCGGVDRFRFDDLEGHGTFICSQGGAGTLAGDGFALVQHAKGCTDADALRMVREAIGLPTRSDRTERPNRPNQATERTEQANTQTADDYPEADPVETVRAAVNAAESGDLRTIYGAQALAAIGHLMQFNPGEWAQLRDRLKVTARGVKLGELEALAKPKREPKARDRRANTPPELASNGGPVIRWEGGELPRVLREAEAALMGQPEELRPYRRGSELVRLGRLTPADLASLRRGIERQEGTLAILPVNPEHLTVRLAHVASWEKYDARMDEYKRINPPGEVARYLIATADELSAKPLTGVIEAPTLRPDGSLLDCPGYDAATGIYYEPGGVKFPKIAEHPTQAEAVAAAARIAHYLRGFPFSDEAGNDDNAKAEGSSRAVALSAVLTAVCRRSLPSAPMHAIDAPAAGSGKSLLVDFVSIVATGRAASVMAYTDDPAEERKRLFSALCGGDLVIAIDNVSRAMDSDTLCSALTQSVLQDRVLGTMENRTVPTNSLILATGNNIRVRGDLVRRTLLCRLDPKVSRPDQRSFDFDLKEEAHRDRAAIVADALTILRAYVAAGLPPVEGLTSYGSFEHWSKLVRGALLWIGETDPLANRSAIEEADPERTALRSIFTAWHEAFGKRAITAATALNEAKGLAINAHELREAFDLVPTNRHELDPRTLGNWLVRYKGRIEDGLRLVSAGTYQRNQLWRIEPVR